MEIDQLDHFQIKAILCRLTMHNKSLSSHFWGGEVHARKKESAGDRRGEKEEKGNWMEAQDEECLLLKCLTHFLLLLSPYSVISFLSLL